MDYEERYKQALEHARVEILANPGLRKTWEEIFPELKESEDERIRKWIVEELEITRDAMSGKNDYSDDPDIVARLKRLDEAIAWLEEQKDIEERWLKDREGCFWDGVAEGRKQKEPHIPWYDLQKSKEAGYTILKTEEYEELIKQKEQKPIQSAEEKEFVRTIKSIISDFIRDKKPEDVGFYQQIYDWLDGRHIEQKPVESISQQTVQGKGVYKICPRCKERMVRDDSKVYTSMPPQYGYECPKCGEMEFDTVKYDNPEMEEQKPAEWSKNDTVFLKEIIDYFENKTTRLQHDIDMYAHWLKSLPQRFSLQPKQEWSEEETKDLVHILKVLDDCYAYGKHDLSKTDHDNLTSTIKSLRPSWKPSEEQMSMLRAVLNDPNNAGAESCRLALSGLYEQLKKL